MFFHSYLAHGEPQPTDRVRIRDLFREAFDAIRSRRAARGTAHAAPADIDPSPARA